MFTYTGSGSIVFGGGVILQSTITNGCLFIFGSAGAAYTNYFFYTSSGGLDLAGSAAVRRGYFATGDGGLDVGGAFVVNTASYIYIPPAAQIEFGGSAISQPTLFTAASGGLDIGGDAEEDWLVSYAGSGGLVLSGKALEGPVSFVDSGAGGIVVGFSASIFASYIYIAPSLIFTLGGEGDEIVNYIYVGTGDLVTTGDAIELMRLYRVGSGTIYLTGEASAEIRAFRYIGSAGLILFAINIPLVSAYEWIANGRLRIRGNAEADSCEGKDIDGIRCIADCNREVTWKYYTPFPDPPLANDQNGAYVPAITVCRQQLWRDCPKKEPLHPYNEDLYKQDCYLSLQAQRRRRFRRQ